MTPDPSPAGVFDRASATYDRVGVDFFSKFGARLVELVQISAGERVLDIGTGRGAVLLPAAEAVGQTGTAHGIDVAAGMIRRTAADLADSHLTHASVAFGYAQTPPEQGAPWDAVLSSLVLFFTDDPAAALQRWTNLLAPDGRIGLVTFVPDPDDQRFRDVIQAHLPPAQPAETEQPAAPSSFDLVRDTTWLDSALAAAGVPEITAHVERHATIFTDADQWWRWAWSQGMRVALEQLSAEQHEPFLADIRRDLDRHRLPDGRMGMHVGVRYTIARR